MIVLFAMFTFGIIVSLTGVFLFAYEHKSRVSKKLLQVNDFLFPAGLLITGGAGTAFMCGANPVGLTGLTGALVYAVVTVMVCLFLAGLILILLAAACRAWDNN